MKKYFFICSMIIFLTTYNVAFANGVFDILVQSVAQNLTSNKFNMFENNINNNSNINIQRSLQIPVNNNFNINTSSFSIDESILKSINIIKYELLGRKRPSF